MTSRATFVGVVIASAFVAQGARAQSPPKLSVKASATQVEVGERFTIELQALVDQSTTAPSDPELRAPASFEVQGPSLSQRTFAQFGGGRQSVQTGIGATWQLFAKTPGHFVIPAPTVRWNGKRLATNSITIDVVQSTGPKQQQSPFLIPGFPNLPGFPSLRSPFGNDPQVEPDDDPATGVGELAMPSAPDPLVFMHAIVDKPSAVVGEQVTISFYLYFKESALSDITERHDAPLSDFVRVPLLKSPGTDPPVRAIVGGRPFAARLLDRMAIFPMRAGDLHTGQMSLRVTGRRVGALALRQTEDLIIHVEEPPKKDRPPGYVLGDVGRFDIGAIVEPRSVVQGGAIGVTVKVQGVGNLPTSLRVPERTGVEWLEPQKKESIEVGNGLVGGSRTFGYVVKIGKSGAVDLGSIDLPYWDPSSKRYEVATVKLGTVDATPSGAAPEPASTTDEPKRDPFATLPGARTSLTPYAPRASSRLLDSGAFFGALAAPPLLVGLVLAGGSARERLKKRREATSTAPGALAKKALDELAAAAKGDASAVPAIAERALHAAIEHASGLKSRGVLVADLVHELEARGLGGDVAKRARDLLATCADARFAGAASVPADLVERTRKTVEELLRLG